MSNGIRKIIGTFLHGIAGVGAFLLGALFILKDYTALDAWKTTFPGAGLLLIVLLGIPNLIANAAVMTGMKFARHLSAACGILLCITGLASMILLPFHWIMVFFLVLGLLQIAFAWISHPTQK